MAKINNNDYIFTNFSLTFKNKNNKKPLTEKSIQEMFNRYKNAIGNSFTIRDLRNSYIINHKKSLPNFVSDEYSIREDQLSQDVDYLSYLKIYRF